MREWTTLKDLCVDKGIQTGPFGSQLHQSDYSLDGTPVIMPVNLVDGGVSEEKIARVSDEHVERLARHKVRKGDLVYARRGDVGRASLIGLHEEGWLCGTGCLRATPDPNKVDSRYLFYLMSQPDIIGWFVNHAKGTTMLNLNTEILSRVPLLYEQSLEQQKRIADILSAYDKLIENNRRQIALLEEAVQRLYKEWFVDLRFPGYETTPIHDDLPEGWGKGSLFDLCMPIRGCSYSSEEVECGEGTLVNLGNLAPYGGFRFGYEKPFSGKCRDDQLISKGDVFIGLTEQAKGLAGYAALIPAVPKGSVISADLMRLIPFEGVSSAYLYGLLRFGRLSDELSPLANGTKIKHLRPDAIARVGFAIPPIPLINKYTDLVSPCFEKVSGLEEQIAFAREARDRLLPKLMSGEIEVV